MDFQDMVDIVTEVYVDMTEDEIAANDEPKAWDEVHIVEHPNELCCWNGCTLEGQPCNGGDEDDGVDQVVHDKDVQPLMGVPLHLNVAWIALGNGDVEMAQRIVAQLPF